MGLNISSNNFKLKTKYGTMAAAAIIGGAYVAFAYLNSGGGGERKEKKGGIGKRSVCVGLLHGGKLALLRLVDYAEARANPQRLNVAECELILLLQKDGLLDFPHLKRIIPKLEMSGNEAKAVQILQKEKLKARNEGKNHEAYEIEMLQVEMLIYKGEFKKAFSCKCLNEEEISDARRPLFKAIILTAIRQPRYEKLAKKFWESFKEVREGFDDPPCFKESVQEHLKEDGIYKLATNFDEFKKVVNRLKDDIHKAQVN